jgi:hypothetical protein
MEKKIFDPKRIGMVFCPRCYGQGYIDNLGASMLSGVPGVLIGRAILV